MKLCYPMCQTNSSFWYLYTMQYIFYWLEGPQDNNFLKNRQNKPKHWPISLLSIVFKVLESLVVKQMISFVRPHLSKQQLGFLRKRSCLDQLLLSIEMIKWTENKDVYNVIYLDLKKNFRHSTPWWTVVQAMEATHHRTLVVLAEGLFVTQASLCFFGWFMFIKTSSAFWCTSE